MDTNTIIEAKENFVNQLLNHLDETRNIVEANKLAFALIDHFKDDRIEKTLYKILEDDRFRGYDGTLFYLFSEVFTTHSYLKFIIDRLINNLNDGEIVMACISIIVETQPPIELKILNQLLYSLKRKMQNNTLSKQQSDMIIYLINFYSGQKEIRKFYTPYLR